MRVLLAGGGSAGHISPLLALADCLRRRDPATEVVALGTAEGLEAGIVPARGYLLETVPRVPLPRSPGPELVRVPGRLTGAVGAAAHVVRRHRSQVVVGFGGYVSAPAYLGARRAGVPLVVHEANAAPGVANRLGARLTRFVAVATPGTRLPHARVLGMPLRTEITRLDRTTLRAQARAELGLEPDRTTLLVTGGSLGALRLNATALASAADLAAAGVQVLLVRGHGKDVGAVAPTGGPPYVVVPYVDRMELAYAAADLVLCRAGANTVAELTAVGLPAVYVPLAYGNGEQRLNALPAVRAGAGLLVEEADCTPEWLRRTLLPLLTDPARLATMAANARRTGVRDGDERLADLVEEALAGARQ